MGNKIKYLLAIVFFPVAIIFLLIRKICKIIKTKTLRQYLSSISLDNIDSLDGVEFEELLEAVFVAKGYRVTKTKKSYDYGADLLIQKNDIIIAVQCKLYYKHSVGNSAVQEASSAKDYYNANFAVVITNSKFSKPAQILAEKIGVELIDRYKLNNLIKDDQYDLKLYI